MPGNPGPEMALTTRNGIRSNRDRADDANHATASSGATLLPRPVASLVSFVTQSTSLSIRLGTILGGAAIDGARVTTLTGLELSRAVIEGILTKAGRDVTSRSGEYGKAEAESLLERSVGTIYLMYFIYNLLIHNHVAGYFALDHYFSVFLRIREFPFLIRNPVVDFQLIAEPLVNPGRDPWLDRIVTGYCGDYNAYPKGVPKPRDW